VNIFDEEAAHNRCSENEKEKMRQKYFEGK